MGARSKFFDEDLEEESTQNFRSEIPINILEKLKSFFERSEIKIALGLILGSVVVGYFAGNIFGTKDLRQVKVNESTSFKNSSNSSTVTSTSNIPKIKVYITGEINAPGVYEITNNSRLNDLLLIAGNVTTSADLSTCNLAALLSDGIKISIPSKNQNTSSANCLGQGGAINIEPGSNASSSSASQSPGSTLVNLNTASKTELETLPGVGPSYANAILDFRSKNGGFKSVSDLQKVKGIGEKRYADLKDLVTI